MFYILLDTPFNPSVLEPGTTYGKMFIAWLNVDMIGQVIKMGLEFGDTDGYGNELRGKYSQTLVKIMEGSDWLDFVSQVSDGQQTMVEDFQEYLLNKLVIDGDVAGTVLSE